MQQRLKLTAENYYSPEANWEYMSASQFKAFNRCEAAAMAELRGEWGRTETTALLVGSYVDAYFSGELNEFCEAHPEIYKRDGSLKADFAQAYAIACRLERDDLARMLLSGKHQVIKTGKIGGVWYKAKFDSLLNPSKVEKICKLFPNVRELVPFGGSIIVDLKVMRDLENIWNDDEQDRISFVEHWGYDIQGAIYQKIENHLSPFVIVAATKEPATNIEAMHIPDDYLSFRLADVEELSPRYAAIKRGEIEPIGCGKCAYCRSMKRLTKIKHFKLIDVA